MTAYFTLSLLAKLNPSFKRILPGLWVLRSGLF